MLLNACWQFGNTLLLSSNNRISSFYWIRGSKHCFLTSFSNLNCIFLFLVFFAQSLLTSFYAPFSAAWESDFSSRFFIPLVLQVPRCTCALIFLAHMMRFLKARCLWEPGTRISTGFLFPFRLLPKVSHANTRWAIVNHTFSSHAKSSNWHFLSWHKPLLSQRSTARARNPQGISKLVNKGWLLLVWRQLLDDSPSALGTCLRSSGLLALCSIR